ncbi:HAMP domain-containing histidine kinase [Antarcticibacterium flavum]|uniref:histidine kinase n=1 Tax=Antarcticibacterium flavum TaxID=2058175 RepID=A0A5B7X440_9FLAO|nr:MULTISPECIES: HAMP domain-containing sensor histidine kinase [Antarcticibacterium]MCM4158325.1 histidine kinase [Antarcticibacterium sp. W02-3]QCY70089.1 HAMP domain-containing histidine kinase [Antarcticibacterium flavum]
MQVVRKIESSQRVKKLKTLKNPEVADVLQDNNLDNITRMAAQILEVPIAIISLIEGDKVWFESTYGLEVQEIEKNPGWFPSAILGESLYQVENAALDMRTKNHPLVKGDFGLRFYSAIALRDRNGHNLGTLSIIDKKPRSLNRQQQTILREFGELAVQHFSLKREMKNAVKHQHQILHITAHDLKNPISVMPLLADMILMNKANPKAIEEIARQLKSAGKRMNRIVNGLLETAREETGRVQLRLKPMDLVPVVKKVIRSNKTMARSKNQVIKTFLPDEGMVFGDPLKLTEVLDNLVNNAIKYSPTGKEIHVKLEEGPETITICVKDFGPGLTVDDMKNLFRKFTSLSAQPTGGETSTGLGLSIVKQLVDAHRGKVYANSEGKGKGSEFIVELARCEA